jgi:hypothetical protein
MSSIIILVEDGVVQHVYNSDSYWTVDMDNLQNGECPTCQDAIDESGLCASCNVNWDNNDEDIRDIIERIEKGK